MFSKDPHSDNFNDDARFCFAFDAGFDSCFNRDEAQVEAL